MRRSATGFIALSLVASVSLAAEPSNFAIVGYLPHYRADVFRAEQAARLTDLVLFAVEPKPDGSLDKSKLTPEFLKAVERQLAGTPVQKLVTIGGWGQSDAFARVTAEPRLRATLVRELVRLCDEHTLGGIDVDWEHPASEAEHRAYAEFLAELHMALQPKQRIVTLAIAPWQPLIPEAISAVDRIHLMAYDNGGRHSTFSLAFDAVDKLLRQGVPAHKIVLGIPFYGRPFAGAFGEATTYRELLEQATPKPAEDEIGGIFFNGPELVARKVRLAQRLSLGGVMIWEIGQDTTDAERSLLHAIHRAAAASERSPDETSH